MEDHVLSPPFTNPNKYTDEICTGGDCDAIKCKWVCRQKPVEMNARPVCEPPNAKIVCDPAPVPKCSIKTSKPSCKVECVKKDNGCFDCQTVCNPIKAKLVCDNPKPSCRVVAPPPKCKRDYELPKEATRPQCKLVCPATDGSAYSYSAANFDVDN
tara:strand:- start:1640 stop:2107 length:468 start_codon:yes stop_codon:yes gene_type:complete